MYPEERRRVIVERAHESGRVEVSTLAELLDVTPETVRRDLTRLEQLGEVMRVHGGAVPADRLGFEPSLQDRRRAMAAEKDRIAKAALEFVPEDGGILIDAGSTTSVLARALPTDRDLTVVTNSVDIAGTLASNPRLNVLVLGGRLRGRTLATVDAWAVDQLRDIYVDVAFIATNGLSVERGLTTPDANEARVKAAMVDAARSTVLLADHTKVGDDLLVRFADLDRVDTLVTDSGLDATHREHLEAAGVRVVVA